MSDRKPKIFVEPYKRYLYAYPNMPNVLLVGLFKQDSESAVIHAHGEHWKLQFSTLEQAFEETFSYGSTFVKWIDEQWVTTDISELNLQP